MRASSLPIESISVTEIPHKGIGTVKNAGVLKKPNGTVRPAELQY